MIRAHKQLIYICIIWFLLTLNTAWPQAENSPLSRSVNSSVAGITGEQLKLKIETLSSNKTINEAVKAQLITQYQSAQEYLASIATLNEKTAEFETAFKKAPEKTKKLQQDNQLTQERPVKPKLEDFSRISTGELEQRLILEKGKLSALDEQYKNLEKELSVQIERPKLIRQETVAAQQNLETAQKKYDALPENQILKPETEAGVLQLAALIEAGKAELKMLAAESGSNLIRVELLKAELQSLKLQKDQLSPIINTIEVVFNERKQQEAHDLENELTQAEKTASGKHPLIQKITRENIQFSRDLQAINGKIEIYSDRNRKVEGKAKQVEDDFKSAEKKITLAGLSPVLGKILREQRRNLMSKDQFVLESENIQEEMALTSLEQFKIEDRLKHLSDGDNFLNELMTLRVETNLSSDRRMMIQAELRILLNNQKELLNKLSAAYSNHIHVLGDLDFAKQQLLTQSEKFAAFLDERLLWVPSSAPVNAAFLSGLYDSAGWLLSPRNWLTLLKDAGRIAWEKKFISFIGLLSLILVPKLRGWAKSQLREIAKKAEKKYSENFSDTLKALLYQLILVSPLPFFVYLLGWYLNANSAAVNFNKAVGAGLESCALPLFGMQLIYRLFAADGFACHYFQWQKPTAYLLQRQIAWLRFVIVPCFFIIYCTGASSVSAHGDHLGRLALVIVMSSLCVFFIRVLNPATGLFQGYIKSNPDDGFTRLRFLWYPAVVLIPIAITGFAVAGYYLSALELQEKLVITIRLFFSIVIFYGLMIHWLTVVNRELALKNARQKRKTAALSEKQAALDRAGEEMPVIPVEEQLIDIPTINAQTIKLLIVFMGFAIILGLWMIWRNILPAFSILDNIVLWQHLVMVDNEESYQPVTLTNLLLAGLYGFIVVVSVRNFPGLVELLLFSRLSVAPGARYAVNQLARYVIIAIGFIFIANELGGSWSQVQWLVAALSVGLGFGLQEIFANLVSGIILLFERPIRVGDTITINNVTGTVSRIQMRATTIIDFDHKELIVPNKTFITSQLVNWTLSDTITRIQVPVIIAYNSDVELAHGLMLETARSIPLVLEDPAPNVIFTGIKDCGLEFSVTVFVSELGHRQKVTHNLHLNLEKILKRQGIAFPFQQRELRFTDSGG